MWWLKWVPIADNKADTVAKGIREGVIADAFLADSNKNKREEVYVIIRNPANASNEKKNRYEAESVK